MSGNKSSIINHQSSLLELENVHRHFTQGGERVDVLNGVNLSIKRGEIVALVGPSGSGKTTMMQIAGLLDKPQQGLVKINGEDFSKASDKQRTLARRQHLGFVYQFHHLLPEFTAFENVNVPQIIAGKKPAEYEAKTKELLEAMGLADRMTHRPSQLSGGQQQRVAIARALANNPSLILADEPTGNLDEHNSGVVFDLLRDLIKKNNCCALIATHNQALVEKMDRVLKIHSGRIE